MMPARVCSEIDQDCGFISAKRLGTILSAIRNHLKPEASAAAADRVRDHLLKRMESLRHNPRLRVRTSEPDIRILPPTRYPDRRCQLYRLQCLQSSKVCRLRTRSLLYGHNVSHSEYKTSRPMWIPDLACFPLR